MVDTEHVLVDAKKAPAELARELARLLVRPVDDVLMLFPDGAWLEVDPDGWFPYEDDDDTAHFNLDVAINGGGWKPTEVLAREVFDVIVLRTDWDVGLLIADTLVARRGDGSA